MSSQSGFFESRGPPKVVKVDASKSSTTLQLDLHRVRDHDATTPRRRLYTAASGGGEAPTKQEAVDVSDGQTTAAAAEDELAQALRLSLASTTPSPVLLLRNQKSRRVHECGFGR